MPIALTKPFFLLIWLFIPVIWLLINRSGLKDQPRRRRMLIGGLRTLLILLLGLALSHPKMLKGSDRVNLFFCLDLSESIEKGGEKKAMEFINRARSGMEGEDRSGLIVF